MYRESHYHSTTHECLGVFRGHAKLRFGVSNDDNPDDAVVLDVKSGDVIVIPAGVAHCALNESGEFSMVGAYPEVQTTHDTVPFPFCNPFPVLYLSWCLLSCLCSYPCLSLFLCLVSVDSVAVVRWLSLFLVFKGRGVEC